MTQLQAGYILDCVRDVLESKFAPVEIRGLLTQLSFFDIDVTSTGQLHGNSGFEQILSVCHNIISRGLPTRPTLWLEDKILQAFELTRQDEQLLEIGSIRRELKIDDSLRQKIFRALHIIDPDLNKNNISTRKIKTWENLESPYEESFLYELLPRYASAIWVQLFEVQRELENVLRFSTTTGDEIDRYLNGTVQVFNNQRLDFCVEFPYEMNGQRGFVVEIDGKATRQLPPKRY